VASFPSPDYWMPLPATGSRPAVLGRRWTSAFSTLSAPPRDCWTLAQRDNSTVPVLERHWACGGTLSDHAPPLRRVSDGEETVTVPAKATPSPPDYLSSPDRTATAIPPTVTPAPPKSLVETVTLLPPDSHLQSVTLTPPSQRQQTVTRLCVGCGKPLEGKRPQAKAHGVACRQRAYRRRKKEAAQAQRQQENQRASQLEPVGLHQTTVGSAPR
jgi:hypothetical protein